MSIWVGYINSRGDVVLTESGLCVACPEDKRRGCFKNIRNAVVVLGPIEADNQVDALAIGLDAIGHVKLLVRKDQNE